MSNNEEKPPRHVYAASKYYNMVGHGVGNDQLIADSISLVFEQLPTWGKDCQ